MLKRSLGILVVVLVQTAHFSGYLGIEITTVCTLAILAYIFPLNRRRGRVPDGQRIHRSRLFDNDHNDHYRSTQIFSLRGAEIFFSVGLVMLFSIVYLFFFSSFSKNGDSDLNPQKADEYRQKQKERRETLNKLNKDALKGFRESRDIVDENILKPKAEKVLEDVNAALELADGVEKTQLLDMKAILLHDLGQLTEAEETYGKYVESGGDKVDFPRALYDAELYERSQAALKLVLAKKRPCEAVILESQILFKLGQGEEASERFFDLGTCSYTPHYEELKAQYEEFKASKGK